MLFSMQVRLQAQRIARVIVQDSQRVATRPAQQRHMAFEVHLPQVVGMGMLKALPRHGRL